VGSVFHIKHRNRIMLFLQKKSTNTEWGGVRTSYGSCSVPFPFSLNINFWWLINITQ